MVCVFGVIGDCSSDDDEIGPPLSHSNPSKFEYAGCWNDQNDRALPIYGGQTNNPNTCHEAAVRHGATHFGLQDDNECWTSSGRDLSENYKRYGPGDPWYCSRDINGSEWINQVYKVVQPAPPARNIPASPPQPDTCTAAQAATVQQASVVAAHNREIEAVNAKIAPIEKMKSDYMVARQRLMDGEQHDMSKTLMATVNHAVAIEEDKLVVLRAQLTTPQSDLTAAEAKLNTLRATQADFCAPYDGSNKYTDNQNPARYNYSGCYADAAAPRALPIIATLSSTSSEPIQNKCRNAANEQGSRYFGLQNGNECWLSEGDDNTQNYDRYGIGTAMLCRKNINGEPLTNHVYRIKTNEELGIHDNLNTQENNMNYSSFYDGDTGKYNYVGCWAQEDGQGLAVKPDLSADDLSTEEKANRACYTNAYKNNKKYYGLTRNSDGKLECRTSNGVEDNYMNYNIKGFTKRCRMGGGIKTNQVYNLTYTQSDETAKIEALNTILVTVKENDVLVKGILTDMQEKLSRINTYTNDALTALGAGNAKLVIANSYSSSAFNDSGLAMQKSALARRLLENPQQQANASQTAAIVREFSRNSIASVAISNSNISEAQTQYSQVIINNNLVNGEKDNINANIVTANGYLQTAKSAYNAFQSYFLSTAMRAKMNEIEVFIGPQAIPFTTTPAPTPNSGQISVAPEIDTTETIKENIAKLQAVNSLGIMNFATGEFKDNFTDIPHTQDNFDTTQDLKTKENFARVQSKPEDIPLGTGPVAGVSTVTARPTSSTPTIVTTISSISTIINSSILPIASTMNGYANTVTTVKNPEITFIQDIISQTTTASTLASGNASEIIARAALEIARSLEIKSIEQQQQAQLAAADAAQAAVLQAQFDAANEQKAKLNALSAKVRATQAQLVYERQIVQSDSLNKQIDLMNKLNIDILNVNNSTTLEGFTNPLPTVNNQEIDNYVNTFNNGLSLLNDPNNMTKVAFDTYIHIQNKKLDTLTKNLDILNSQASLNTNMTVKGLRSMNNSEILNVEAYPDPTKNKIADPNSKYTGNGSANYPNYLIYGNNGCLQYESSTTQTPATWDFKSCNAKEPRQQFTMKKITNLQEYNQPITNPNNKSYKMNNQSNVNFGFYTVNPNNVADQCLQLNNDGISVMPCNLNSSQRFGTNYNTVL